MSEHNPFFDDWLGSDEGQRAVQIAIELRKMLAERGWYDMTIAGLGDVATLQSKLDACQRDLKQAGQWLAESGATNQKLQSRLDSGVLSRDIDHGHGTLGKGCKYETVEGMLKSRLKAAQKALTERDAMIETLRRYRALVAEFIQWHKVIAYSDFDAHEAAHDRLCRRARALEQHGTDDESKLPGSTPTYWVDEPHEFSPPLGGCDPEDRCTVCNVPFNKHPVVETSFRKSDEHG